MSTDRHNTVFELIHARMDELSEAERRVARSLLADYPASGLSTSHALAAAAGTSAPTVVRFATRLGFRGFTELQDHLRNEISDTATSPVERATARGTRARSRDDTGLAAAMQRRADAVNRTLQLTPTSQISAAASMIADCPKQVLITGGFFSGSIARILALQLSQIRRDVIYVEEPLRRDAGLILDARKHCVLVVFDLRRYEPAACTLASQAKNHGLDVIVLTDRWLSPAAAHADIVLSADVEAVPFDTFVALLALSESVVEATLEHAGARGLRRMSDWEVHAIGHHAIGHHAAAPNQPIPTRRA